MLVPAQFVKEKKKWMKWGDIVAFIFNKKEEKKNKWIEEKEKREIWTSTSPSWGIHENYKNSVKGQWIILTGHLKIEISFFLWRDAIIHVNSK